MIEPGIGARFDRQISIFALVVGDATTGAGKVRIERRVVLIHRVVVTPRGVGLPYFDQGIRYRTLVFIQHTPDHNDALAHGFFARCWITCEIIFAWFELDIAE